MIVVSLRIAWQTKQDSILKDKQSKICKKEKEALELGVASIVIAYLYKTG